MTRSLACFSISFSLWLAMAGPAAGQAAAEAGLGAAGASTATAPSRGIGKSMSGLSDALQKALHPGEAAAEERPVPAATAKAHAKTTATGTPASASPATPPAVPAPTWEDAAGIEKGLAYEELVRRFGPPAMAITNGTERSLTYKGKDGMFQVEVRDGAVATVVKPPSRGQAGQESSASK